jgi:hypothetical protein
MKSKKNEARVSIASKLPNQKTKSAIDNEFKSIMKWASLISGHPHLYHPLNQMIANYHYYSIEFL